MTYIVNDKCIKCGYRLCRGLPRWLFLRGREYVSNKPDECIDCGVCEPECPIDAIEPDTNPNTEEMLLINKEYSLTKYHKRKSHCQIGKSIKMKKTNLTNISKKIILQC